MGVLSYKLASSLNSEWANGWLAFFRNGLVKSYYRSMTEPKEEIPEGDIATIKLMEGSCSITLVLPKDVELKYKELHTALIKLEGGSEDHTYGGKLIISPTKPLQVISMPKQDYESNHLTFVFSYSEAKVEPFEYVFELYNDGNLIIRM